ncbi:MAG: DUF4062 domain-containing protein [Deltaproteobacteria bacterium]|nr:DUF4062 domain-containing protein [Deltaproteobacteria bacterium]
MDKRYQVFISSTYSDLKDERQQVMQTLLEMDCIPTGMELFPAADEEQFEFIKKVIDDCDYYLVIIGGRYGSTTADGISFTEKEYDYAVGKGMHIIALVHGNPEVIPAGKTEMDPEARLKLDAFRDKVSTGRLIKNWAKAEDLPTLVMRSLMSAIKSHPAIGWVRANSVANVELLQQVNQLQQRNDQLTAELSTYKSKYVIDTSILAKGDQIIKLNGIYKIKNFKTIRNWTYEISWSFILSILGPHLLTWQHEAWAINNMLAKATVRANGINVEDIQSCEITEELFQTVKIQLMALGLIDVQPSAEGTALFWRLTEAGKAELLKTASIKAISQE